MNKEKLKKAAEFLKEHQDEIAEGIVTLVAVFGLYHVGMCHGMRSAMDTNILMMREAQKQNMN